MIIGLTGLKGAGKTTMAQVMVEEFGFRRIGFADAIKSIVVELFDLYHEQVWGEEKDQVDKRWGLTPRYIMQKVGTEVGREIHPDVWVRTLERAILDDELDERRYEWEDWAEHEIGSQPNCPTRHWVIDDVRFPNEAAMIAKFTGFVWRVDAGKRLPESADTHASETQVIPAFSTLWTDNDVETCKQLLRNKLNDTFVRWGKGRQGD